MMMRENKFNLKSSAFFKWSQWLLVVVFGIFVMVSCSKEDRNQSTTPKGPYANGFFILNEGWFGHEPGSVNFYGYGADTLEQMAFATANEGSAPTIPSATLEDGLIIGDHLFLISKSGGPITVAEAATLKQLGQITFTGADFRSMAALDATRAVVSSGNDIYTIDLNALTISTTPVFTGTNIKKLSVNGKFLVASDNKGVDIIQISNWKLLAHFDGPTEGYVTTPDGQLYGAGGSKLVAIDAATQDTTQIPLTQSIWVNDYAYNAPCLVSSSTENAVFYIANPTSGFAGNTIYKYIKGDATSLTSPFITLPATETFYGTGLAYDKKNDQLITWSITGYSESDRNYLRFYNASTGALVKTIIYGHIYLPGNIVFYP